MSSRLCYFTPDNPADDDPKMLTAELAKGATHNNYVEFEDRAEGIKHAIEVANPGDTVVLASKGREPYQIMPGHVKVPHRDDLIGLEAAYKSLENPTMIIKQLSEQNEIINVYLYEHVHHSYYMIAIPDMFWSVELNAQLNEQEINEELIMQLFTFKEESEALRIASQLSKWIIKDLKENNE